MTTFPAGFQQGPGGFQNDCDGGPKGFQCRPTMPTPGIEVTKVYVDSTVELMADHFSLELVSPTTLFSQAPALKTVAIQLGLLQSCVTPQTITHISNGVIDEYELQATPTEQVLRVRGRDAMANLLDCEFVKTYIFAEYSANGQLTTRAQGEINGIQKQTTVTFADGSTLTLPPTPKVEGVDWEVGVFSAKNIAQDIANKVGLQLLWQVRDYQMQQTFTASGRAIDSIKKLVEPWAQVEPFRADIFVQGTTLIVRHRQLPTQPMAAQQAYNMDVKTTKRTGITIRKRALKPVGPLRLTGRAQTIKTGFVSVFDDNGDEQVDVTTTSVAGGNTIVTMARVFVQDRTVVKRDIRTYSSEGLWVEWTQTFNDYQDFDIGRLCIQSTTTTQKWDDGAKSLRDFQQVTQFNTYDDETSLLRTQVTVIEESSPQTSGFVAAKMIVKNLIDLEAGMVEERVSEYSPSSGMSQGAAAAAGSAFWDLIRQDSQIQAGHRAGGAGRKGYFIPNFPGSQANIEIAAVLDPAKCNPSASYSNPNLNLQDLQFLQSLFAAKNKFAFEWEVILSGVAMPWLQKGTVIQVTGFTGPYGDPVPLPPLYITEVRTTYEESGKSPAFTSQVRCFGWQ
jgi:hypothetical protein